MRPPFTVDSIESGAKDRIAFKLKDVERINIERPCPKCSHYSKDKSVKCTSTRCNFYHSDYNPIETK